MCAPDRYVPVHFAGIAVDPKVDGEVLYISRRVAAIIAFIVCILFSASSHTMD